MPVANATLTWKLRKSKAIPEDCVGYIDLNHWKFLHIKMLMSIGTAQVGHSFVMDSDMCSSQVWTISEIFEKSGSEDWGAGKRIDFVCTANSPVNIRIIDELDQRAAIVPTRTKAFNIYFRNYTNPKAIASLRTLSVLWSDSSDTCMDSDNKCLSCKFRRAMFFCFDDKWGVERKTCQVCNNQLLKSPLTLSTVFNVSIKDMNALREKAGRVYENRMWCHEKRPGYTVKIRVRDVEAYFGQTWCEFVCSTGLRRQAETSRKRRSAARGKVADGV